MIHTFYTYWSFQLALPMAIEDGKRMKWDALLFPLVVCIYKIDKMVIIYHLVDICFRLNVSFSFNQFSDF